MLRVAVVGCGKAGENHVREISALSEARLVAVCDVEPVMAEQLSLRYRVPRHYSDVEVMLACAESLFGPKAAPKSEDDGDDDVVITGRPQRAPVNPSDPDAGRGGWSVDKALEQIPRP